MGLFLSILMGFFWEFKRDFLGLKGIWLFRDFLAVEMDFCKLKLNFLG